MWVGGLGRVREKARRKELFPRKVSGLKSEGRTCLSDTGTSAEVESPPRIRITWEEYEQRRLDQEQRRLNIEQTRNELMAVELERLNRNREEDLKLNQIDREADMIWRKQWRETVEGETKALDRLAASVEAYNEITRG